MHGCKTVRVPVIDREARMHYELYADSLWLLNFVMNLYILLFADRRLLRIATRVRLLTAAAVGACWYLVPFLWNGPALVKYAAGMAGAAGSMLWIAFRPRTWTAWRACAIQLALVSFLLGGMLLAVLRVVPWAERITGSVPGLLIAGSAAVWLILRRQRTQEREERECACRVTLCCGGRRLRVDALVDSGNSLREPISGKPVSVLDEKIFREFFDGTGECFRGFRAVPYHSVGHAAGILKAYCIPELRMEYRGCVKTIREAYIAVSPGPAGGVKMLLNPEVLE